MDAGARSGLNQQHIAARTSNASSEKKSPERCLNLRNTHLWTLEERAMKHPGQLTQAELAAVVQELYAPLLPVRSSALFLAGRRRPGGLLELQKASLVRHASIGVAMGSGPCDAEQDP